MGPPLADAAADEALVPLRAATTQAAECVPAPNLGRLQDGVKGPHAMSACKRHADATEASGLSDATEEAGIQMLQ